MKVKFHRKFHRRKERNKGVKYYNMSKMSKRVTVTDTETGEIVSDSVNFGTQNGDGWMIMYRESILKLSENAPSTALKIFLNLSARQEFESGIKVTKKFIADSLKMSATQVWRGFKWLKENDYVKEHKVAGVTEFILNPDVTTCGKNKKDKVELWNSIP